MLGCRRRWRKPLSPSLPNFTQELLGRYKKWILLKNASDDDHRMRPHDVDDRVSSEFSEMVGADDRVVVSSPQIIHPRFELDEVVDVGSIFHCPVHATANAAEWKSSLDVAAGHLLERFQHPVLVETAVAKVRFGIGPKFELAALPGGSGVDPGRGQPLQVVAMLIGIHDVNGSVASLEAVLNKRKQHAVFFVVAVEKRADMTYFAELRTGERNWYRSLLHGVLLPQGWTAAMGL
jgi:hypothetical protein